MWEGGADAETEILKNRSIKVLNCHCCVHGTMNDFSPTSCFVSVFYICFYVFTFIILEVKAEVTSDSLQPHGLYSPWNSPGQHPGVGRLSLLQGIFPTQGSNPGLPHFRHILYQLSHKENPRTLE